MALALACQSYSSWQRWLPFPHLLPPPPPLPHCHSGVRMSLCGVTSQCGGPGYLCVCHVTGGRKLLLTPPPAVWGIIPDRNNTAGQTAQRVFVNLLADLD